MTSPSARGLPSAPALPARGVVRIARDPAALHAATDEAGPNRYDDPRPRSLDRYQMRYAARTVRGCLLELLDHLRPPGEDAATWEASVNDDDDLADLLQGEPLPGGHAEPWQAVHDFLAGRRVATLGIPPTAWVVSVHDATVQATLTKATAVRALLVSDQGRAALLPAGAARSRQPRLDQAAVRLSTDFGRLLTQAISLDLRDRTPRPDAIHYRSRHDDAEDCWAIYDHTDVSVTDVRALSPDHPVDHAAMHAVAALWDLPLPPQWQQPGSE